MEIPDDKLEEFRRLYEKHFGERIGLEDAREKGSRLVRLIRTIFENNE